MTTLVALFFGMVAHGAAVGVVVSIFPTWRGATIRIADGLRRIG